MTKPLFSSTERRPNLVNQSNRIKTVIGVCKRDIYHCVTQPYKERSIVLTACMQIKRCLTEYLCKDCIHLTIIELGKKYLSSKLKYCAYRTSFLVFTYSLIPVFSYKDIYTDYEYNCQAWLYTKSLRCLICIN